MTVRFQVASPSVDGRSRWHGIRRRTGPLGLAASSQPLAPPALYRPRNPRATALYQLLEAYYEDVKAVGEERFEKHYGFWRGFVDTVVARYLDCGTEEAGFARLRCDTCGVEKLLTLSCKQRGICPSCDAKRAAAFAALLKDELLENVGHCLWGACAGHENRLGLRPLPGLTVRLCPSRWQTGALLYPSAGVGAPGSARMPPRPRSGAPTADSCLLAC